MRFICAKSTLQRYTIKREAEFQKVIKESSHGVKSWFSWSLSSSLLFERWRFQVYFDAFIGWKFCHKMVPPLPGSIAHRLLKLIKNLQFELLERNFFSVWFGLVFWFRAWFVCRWRTKKYWKGLKRIKKVKSVSERLGKAEKVLKRLKRLKRLKKVFGVLGSGGLQGADKRVRNRQALS